MLNKIIFENFKIFKTRQVLEIKPITILIGKNNSGKSAIAKLPTMIANALKGNFSVPFKWENEGISLGISNEDLIYNKSVTNNLSLQLTSEMETLSVSVYVDRYGKLHYSNYQYKGKDLDINETKFRGLTYGSVNFNDLLFNFDYIGPYRKLPDSDYPNSFDDFYKIGIEGENAYPLLIQWSKDNNPYFKKISEWYEKNFEGWKLKVSQISGLTQRYEIALSKDGLSPVNIINVGQGIHQALPLVVRSIMPANSETLIIIEEPETHLHPAAHGNLAERFVDSFIEDRNKYYLIETHSQNFTLRLRRLVAEGKMNPNDLAIYFIDYDENLKSGTAKKIEIDDNGGVKNKDWPEGIFNETSLETRAIFNAHLNNLQYVDRD